jgi:CubicO group peptidase (beta-lactamase class C family)
MRLYVLPLAAAIIGLAAAAPVRAGVTTEGDFRIEYAGTSIGKFTNLDNAVMSWMAANSITAAQLAVRQNGVLLVSHAYTMGAANPLVTTTNAFRLASISKMVATAALSTLMEQGKLTGGETVFPYLGITKPLFSTQTPDPHVNNIITLELAEHTSGMPGSGAGDPLFMMRDIEVQLGHEPLTAQQFAEYLNGTKLNSIPGFVSNYSNVGYVLLGEVIAKAAGTSYFNYVKNEVLKPLGMTNWVLSPTSQLKAIANEVPALDPYTGPSVFDISPHAPLEPFNYEGGDIIWELAAAPTDLATNAESVSLFVHTWNAYGLGGRQYDYARDGCTPGVATWVESLTADIDFALLFNSQPCLDFSSTVIQQIEAALRACEPPIRRRERGSLGNNRWHSAAVSCRSYSPGGPTA